MCVCKTPFMTLVQNCNHSNMTTIITQFSVDIRLHNVFHFAGPRLQSLAYMNILTTNFNANMHYTSPNAGIYNDLNYTIK